MTTWIFLRGLTRESRHWGSFLGLFQQTFSNADVVTLDLAGNGLLNRQASPRSVEGLMADCRRQLAQREMKPPYHVLAMSLGAMVSVAWVQSYPHEIAAQVLINTSMRPYSPFFQRLRPRNYGSLVRLAWQGTSPELSERTILTITSNRQDESVLPAWLALRCANPVSAHNAFNQLIAASRFCAQTGPLAVPTLLLASELDQLVSANCSRTLARAWKCDLQLHSRAGHDLPLDDGPWVIETIARWLSHR
jgi:alpha-beta hydrolase superfamily lysophospholipase